MLWLATEPHGIATSKCHTGQLGTTQRAARAKAKRTGMAVLGLAMGHKECATARWEELLYADGNCFTLTGWTGMWGSPYPSEHRGPHQRALNWPAGLALRWSGIGPPYRAYHSLSHKYEPDQPRSALATQPAARLRHQGGLWSPALTMMMDRVDHLLLDIFVTPVNPEAGLPLARPPGRTSIRRHTNDNNRNQTSNYMTNRVTRSIHVFLPVDSRQVVRLAHGR